MPFVGGMHRRSTLSGSIREGEVNSKARLLVGADPPLAARKGRSVSVAIRTVFLLPEEEGTVLGAPRGVSHCRDITNFAIVLYHTRQGRSPGTLHCNAGYDPHK